VATANKVLGQSAPLATTMTDVYTVPAATEAIVSSLVVCNRDLTNTSFRIAVRPAGAALSDEHYQYYNSVIFNEDTFIATIGMTLEATDVISVYAADATLSFTVYGQEIT